MIWAQVKDRKLFLILPGGLVYMGREHLGLSLDHGRGLNRSQHSHHREVSLPRYEGGYNNAE